MAEDSTSTATVSVSIQGRTDEPFRFSAKYEFEKPNDRRALDLMNAAAKAVMNEHPDIVISYGISDEYRCVSLNLPIFRVRSLTSIVSFVFHKSCNLFERRSRYEFRRPMLGFAWGADP